MRLFPRLARVPCVRVQRQWRSTPIVAMGVLGLMVTPISAAGATLIIVSSLLLARIVRPRNALRCLTALLAGTVAEAAVFGIPIWTSLLTVAATLASAGHVLFSEHRQSEERLRRAQREATEMATMVERQRRERDAYDRLGHVLAVIVMKSDLALKLATRDRQRTIQEMRDVEDLAREALIEVRHAVGRS